MLRSKKKLNEKKFGNPEMAENLIAEDIVVVDERDTRSSSSSFFFFFKATTFDYSTLNSTSVHCL